MVKVREDFPRLENGKVDIAAWIERLPIDKQVIHTAELQRAFEVAEKSAAVASDSYTNDENFDSFYNACLLNYVTGSFSAVKKLSYTLFCCTVGGNAILQYCLAEFHCF